MGATHHSPAKPTQPVGFTHPTSALPLPLSRIASQYATNIDMAKTEPADPSRIRHDFAAWAASRAASTSTLARFPVTNGKAALESSVTLMKISTDPQNLPSPSQFDAWHTKVCKTVQSNLRNKSPNGFAYGVTAKLVNIYLKALVMGHYGHLSDESLRDKIDAVHPPIDRLLLAALEYQDVGGLKPRWRIHKNIAWSKFSLDQYSAVIQDVRSVTDGKLWQIEKYWSGAQNTHRKS